MVNAPFGYHKGKPAAPHGYTKSGNIRKKPLGSKPSTRNYLQGQGDYKIGRTYMRGRGGYITDTVRPYTKGWASKAGGYAGGLAGGFLGNSIAPGIGAGGGAILGGAIGSSLGRKFANITGWGDYKINSNTIMNPAQRDIVPSFGEDSIRVRKRECIGHISASTTFTNNSFPLNPGLSDTFPWLSAIANNYSQYRFNGLVFQFESTSSDAIASTTDLGLGQVILATNYDAESASFVNDLQMLGSTFSNSAKPSENILHAVECAPTDTAQKLYYVRSGDPPVGADLRLYDLGNFQIATVNMPSNYEGMGRVWVSYDVTFVKSVMDNQLGFDINTDKYVLGGISSISAWGSTTTIAEHSNLGTTINSAGTLLSFPPTIESGYYLISYYVNVAVASAQQLTGTFTNCTVVQASSNSGTTTAFLLLNWVVRIDDRDATIAWDPATSLGGGFLNGQLLITQVNGELYV